MDNFNSYVFSHVLKTTNKYKHVPNLVCLSYVTDKHKLIGLIGRDAFSIYELFSEDEKKIAINNIIKMSKLLSKNITFQNNKLVINV